MKKKHVMLAGGVAAMNLAAGPPASAQSVPFLVQGTTVTAVAALGVGAGSLFNTDPLAILFSLPPPGLIAGPKSVNMPPSRPLYLGPAYLAALTAPLPPKGYGEGDVPAVIPQLEYDENAAGLSATYQPGGATVTGSNAFFQSFGTNGRTCATCHQPPSGMSLSVTAIQTRYGKTGGDDPLFAPVDGSNCPNLVSTSMTSGSMLGGLFGLGNQNFQNSHSLLLTRGLFRIFLPVPKNAEYTISVVSDPYGCNTNPAYDQVANADGSRSQIISVYRRPRMAANLDFVLTGLVQTGAIPATDPDDGSPLPVNPATGLAENVNIMADGREPTLESQAIDATLTHAQALSPPTAAQVAQMVGFEKGVYTAQVFDGGAGWLQLFGGLGGPVNLSTTAPGQKLLLAGPLGTEAIMSLYASYQASILAPLRASIIRGEAIFNQRLFNISNVGGFNNALGFTNSIRGTCSTCHNQVNEGGDAIPVSQHDIGIGGADANFGGMPLDQTLPIFQLACPSTANTAFHSTTIQTNDPAKALITGKCADIGRNTVPELRALSSRAPYFSDGSAPNLTAVVNFYNKRFSIGLSAQDQSDLANFLSAL